MKVKEWIEYLSKQNPNYELYIFDCIDEEYVKLRDGQVIICDEENIKKMNNRFKMR